MSEKAMQQPFEHMAEGADTAILFVHGILGTPHHFRDFLPLVPREWSVCNLLLDGHGGTADDFARSSMQKWQAQVSEKLEELKRRHDRILIVAHSMGTLFAISEAIKDPEKIKGLFFLATPLRIWVHPRLVPSMIKVYFNAYKPSDAVCVAYRESCSIENYKYVWRYLRWIPRYLELFSEATRVRRLLPELQVPCRVFQSGRDEMVSHATVKDLQGHPHIRLQVLPHSMHHYYTAEDKATFLAAFSEMVKEFS